MNKEEFERWFQDFIVKPTIDQWGRGWEHLSEKQKRDALQAMCFRNLMGGRLIGVPAISIPEAAALGQHTVDLVNACATWLSRNL